MFKAIVVITVMGSPMVQLDDISNQAYPDVTKCYLRGAQMITSVAKRAPLVQAQAVCVELKSLPQQKQKEEKGKQISYELQR